MIEKKGPFDSAIKVLKEYDLFAESRIVRKSCHLAIPVLDAAGKVDKNDAEQCLLEGHVDAWPEIRAWLESLLDKDGDKKEQR
jgi:hypothetical protein